MQNKSINAKKKSCKKKRMGCIIYYISGDSDLSGIDGWVIAEESRLENFCIAEDNTATSPIPSFPLPVLRLCLHRVSVGSRGPLPTFNPVHTVFDEEMLLLLNDSNIKLRIFL